MADYMNTVEYLRTTGSTAGDESALPVVGQGIYNRNLLERAMPLLYHGFFGQQHSMARRNGLSMVFRRYEKLDQATVPMSDGVTPPGTQLTKTDYVATLVQYGNWTIVTDTVDLFHVDPVITEATDLMGENMGESMDSIIRDALVGGTNLYRVDVDDSGTFAWGTNRSDVSGTLCKSAIERVVRDLKGENAKPFTPMIPPSAMTNTWPVAESFWWLIHTDQEYDIYSSHGGFLSTTTPNGFAGFTPVEQYAGSQGVMKGEIGKAHNTRFVTTTNLKVITGASAGADTSNVLKETTDGHCDVYLTLCFARDAYGVVKPDAAMSRVIVHRAGGPGDPLDQRNTVGWVGWVATVILRQEWMARVEVGSLA